jgi:hypothetical protein
VRETEKTILNQILRGKVVDNVNSIEVVQNYVQGLSLILVTLELIRFLHQRDIPHKAKAVSHNLKQKIW